MWESVHRGCDAASGGSGSTLERGVSDCIRCEFVTMTWEWRSVRENQREVAKWVSR